jgi:hypothetical protein
MLIPQDGGPFFDMIRSSNTSLRFATETSFGTGFSTQMTLTQNGNVGIGTTAPAYKLEVNGLARLGNSIIGNSTSQYPIQFVINSTTHATSKRAVLMLGESGGWQILNDIYANGTNDFGVYGNGRWGLTIQQSTGNVGIGGTVNPVTKLSNSGTLITDGAQAVGSNGFNWTSANSNAYMAGIHNTSTGNGLMVKVGDSDPARKVLHALDGSNNSLFLVSGNGAVQSGYSGTLGSTTIYSNDKLIIKEHTTANTTNAMRLMFGAYSGGNMTGIFSNSGSAFSHLNYGGGTSLAESVTAHNFYTTYSLGVNETGSLRQQIINNGDIRNYATASGTGSVAFNSWYTGSNSRLGYIGFGSTGDNILRIANEQTVLAGIDFNLGGSSLHRMTNAGEVLINTLTPIAGNKLVVNGNATVTGDVRITNATDGILMKTPDGLNTYRITIDNSGNIVTTAL